MPQFVVPAAIPVAKLPQPPDVRHILFMSAIFLSPKPDGGFPELVGTKSIVSAVVAVIGV